MSRPISPQPPPRSSASGTPSPPPRPDLTAVAAKISAQIAELKSAGFDTTDLDAAVAGLPAIAATLSGAQEAVNALAPADDSGDGSMGDGSTGDPSPAGDGIVGDGSAPVTDPAAPVDPAPVTDGSAPAAS